MTDPLRQSAVYRAVERYIGLFHGRGGTITGWDGAMLAEARAALASLEKAEVGYMDRANVVYFTDPPKWATRLERGAWLPLPAEPQTGESES